MPLAKRPLGALGPVSVQGLGCMGLTWAYSTALAGTSEEKEAFVRAALDRGVTLFNSANIYTGGEELLERAFKGLPRESYCIATKFGIKLPEFVPDLRREAVLEACDAALARLGTTYIDLFIVCRMQTSVPLEETMGALKELVAAGKIRAVGLSEASAAQIKLAHSICPLTAVEVEYSVWERSIEEAVLPMCRKLGIAVLAYSPLGRGFLTGAIQSPNDVLAPGPLMGKDFRAICPRFADQDGAFAANKALVDRLAAVAAKKGVTTAQIALAWVHAQGADIFPIPGTTKLANLEDNIAAAAVQLTPEELAAIEAAVPPAEVVGTRYHSHGMSMCFESMAALNEEK